MSFISRYTADISMIHGATTAYPGLRKSSSCHGDAGIKGPRMSSISRYTACISMIHRAVITYSGLKNITSYHGDTGVQGFRMVFISRRISTTLLSLMQGYHPRTFCVRSASVIPCSKTP
jgi:hypothetical protein